MGSEAGRPPPFPEERTVRYHDGVFGTMCSHTVGRPRPGTPEVVLVQGMGVSEYLLPGLAAFGRWTRAHLVELPGLAGSGDPPHELDVAEYGRCVADWIRVRCSAPVVLAGHSSGTQVAARAAIGHPGVAAVVLASPTVDPEARGWLRLLVRWRLDGRREPPGLADSHHPEWLRAGLPRLRHVVSVHLRDDLEDSVSRLRVPLLVVYGRQDRIGTSHWARRLADSVADGAYTEVEGAHTFPWRDPEAWSEPVRRLALRVGGAGAEEAGR